MARKFGDELLVYAWMRNRNTVEFLATVEQLVALSNLESD